MAKKTLIRKSGKIESLAISGVLTEDLIVVSLDGTEIDLKERLLEFEGQSIGILLKTIEEDVLEVIE